MLSEHFSEEEFGLTFLSDDKERLKANAKFLCENILEPLRARFGKPIILTSGYRSANHNLAIGGVPTSYHLFNEGHAAADFIVMYHSTSDIFDYIREQSKLPFDEVILEKSKATGAPQCIHVQVDRFKAPRRLAKVGMTHGQGKYYSVPVNV